MISLLLLSAGLSPESLADAPWPMIDTWAVFGHWRGLSLRRLLPLVLSSELRLRNVDAIGHVGIPWGNFVTESVFAKGFDHTHKALREDVDAKLECLVVSLVSDLVRESRFRGGQGSLEDLNLLLERNTVNFKTAFIFLMLKLFVKSLSEKKLNILLIDLEQLSINPFRSWYPNWQMMIILLQLVLHPHIHLFCRISLCLFLCDPLELLSELPMLVLLLLWLPNLTHFWLCGRWYGRGGYTSLGMCPCIVGATIRQLRNHLIVP